MELYDYLVLAGVIVAFILVAKAIRRRIHNGNSKYSYNCIWTYQKDEGYYETNCEETFMFTEGVLIDQNHFMYCPYCSRKIRSRWDKEEK